MVHTRGNILKLIFLIGFLSPFSVFGQSEFNNWYFGKHAGVTFNSGMPVALSNCAAAFSEDYISVCVSDSTGNLLFYSDWIKVYNSNHQVMPNGCCFSIMPSVHQPLLVVKKLGENNVYYLFSTDLSALTGYPNPSGLRYSVVDMGLDGGLGDISPGQKNIIVPGAERTSDALYGTRHHNNKDVWIVVRGYDNSNLFLSYMISSAGINPVPVTSNSLIQIRPNSSQNTQMIKISPDGSKMVCVYDSLVEFGNFNTSTGQFSPLFTFKYYTLTTVGFSEDAFAEFSIDSKYLYISAQGTFNFLHSYIVQYDATQTDSLQFVQSGIVVHDFLTDYPTGLQMGPDGKIYGTNFNSPFLNVINNPSAPGISCDFQSNAVDLLGNNGWSGLCQFVQKYKAYIHSSGGCQNDVVPFTSDIWPQADSIHWDFGDPSSGSSNFSNLPDPTHTYVTPGTYTIELFVRHIDNRTDTSWQTLTIIANPQPGLGPDRYLCPGDSITLDAGFCSGCTWQWDNLTSGQVNIGNGQTLVVYDTGIYAVLVTVPPGCTGRDTVAVSVSPVPVLTTSPLAKSICSGDSTNITLTTNVPGASFYWTATLTSGNITGFNADSGSVINQILINMDSTAGVVTYHIIPRFGSCVGDTVDFSVTVIVADSVRVSITASVDTICKGTPVTFTATTVNGGSAPVFQWWVNGVSTGTGSFSFIYVRRWG